MIDTEGWSSLDTAAAPEPPELPRQFRRTFGTPDGAAVLAYLHGRTVGIQLPADCTEASLRDLEGQRRLFRLILSMMDRGKQ